MRTIQDNINVATEIGKELGRRWNKTMGVTWANNPVGRHHYIEYAKTILNMDAYDHTLRHRGNRNDLRGDIDENNKQFALHRDKLKYNFGWAFYFIHGEEHQRTTTFLDNFLHNELHGEHLNILGRRPENKFLEREFEAHQTHKFFHDYIHSGFESVAGKAAPEHV